MRSVLPHMQVDLLKKRYRAPRVLADIYGLTGRQFVGFVSDLLMAHIENATQLPRPHSGEPQCKLAVFIDALLNRSVAPRQCYVYAIILLRRFMSRNRFYPLTINNVYRIMLTSVIISSRLLIDNPPTLEQWNELSLSHYGPDMLAVFEQEYLQNIDWDILISFSEYSAFMQRLDVQVVLKACMLDRSHQVYHIALPVEEITNLSTVEPVVLFNK
ncbi:Cyclin superfamily protein [Giardia duodenalis]|uniref:Cyclin superfamily protein n=2 Tax=Giardia intestinalis TaxID=5741 RepID=V6TSI7_GIAIN|nr:Cyclin superfamily protein [Giardia intestinalis]